MTRILFSIAAVGLVGSGTPTYDRCERAAATYSQLNAKAQGCVAASEAPMAVDLAACTAASAACSPADQRTIDRFLDCVGQLPTCDGDLSAWRATYEACAGGAELSPGCTL